MDLLNVRKRQTKSLHLHSLVDKTPIVVNRFFVVIVNYLESTESTVLILN